MSSGTAVLQFVKVLRYRPEGGGFDFIDIALPAKLWHSGYNNNNNNNNNIYLLQLGCNPVAVVMLHVYKT